MEVGLTAGPCSRRAVAEGVSTETSRHTS